MNKILKLINGPEASKTDILLTHLIGILAGLYQLYLCLQYDLYWYVDLVLPLFAYDLVGGIVANLTIAGKKWWHSICHNKARKMLFIAFHSHPFFFIPFFAEFSLQTGIILYVYLIFASLLILHMPRNIHLPVAFTLVIIGMIIQHSIVILPAFAYLIFPLFYMKLLIAFLLPLDNLSTQSDQ